MITINLRNHIPSPRKCIAYIRKNVKNKMRFKLFNIKFLNIFANDKGAAMMTETINFEWFTLNCE